MNFDVIGPIEITRHGRKKIITKQSASEFRNQLEDIEEGLADSCGCYVFAKRAGKGIIPWYVGQACRSRMGMEALNAENRSKYNDVLEGKGTPVLFVIPARTPTGKLRRRPSKALQTLSFLEKYLIAAALDRNPTLINSKETRFMRELHVVGILNPKKGEATTASRDLYKTLFS